MIRTTRRYWWLGLVMVAAMVVGMPTALAQGPLPEAAPVAGTLDNGPNQDGDYPLEFGLGIHWDYPGTADDRYGGHQGAAWLKNWLLAGGWVNKFFWENGNSWEGDFKRMDWGGWNNVASNYGVDTVDFMFYAGHGNPDGFSFDTSTGPGTHTDSWLSYSDARMAWGDADLEWMGLWSCSVLADTHRGDWAWAMNKLHLLMGFKTTAYAYQEFGYWLGYYLRYNWTFASAWMTACDAGQPAGTVARILAEDPAYWNERPFYRYNDTYDNYYHWWDHTCGSEYPRAAAPLADNSMPVFMTPPLNLAEQATEWNSLTSAFGLPAASTRVMASMPMSGTSAGTAELTMDTDSGLYYFIDHGKLFTATAASMATQANITPGEAQQLAMTFLNNAGLLPGDAQFYEVASNGISSGISGARATGVMGTPDTVMADTVTDYSVIFSRILTYTAPANGVQAAQVMTYSVGGPGAKMKVYVDPAGPPAAGSSVAASSIAAASGVVGAQGGWRRIDNNPQVPGIQATVLATTTVLDFPVIAQLFQELEPMVALAAVPVPGVTSRTILSHTVFYWEEPTLTGQDQLYPAYDLTVEYHGVADGNPITVTDHTYVPAAAGYMRPYAEILDKPALQGTFVPGTHLQAHAADAAANLSDLGHDGLLSFPLGTGPVYLYEWFVEGPDGQVSVGVGADLDWIVDPAVLVFGKGGASAQTLTLKVTDPSSPHTAQSFNNDSVQFSVVQPIYMPLVVKGF